MAVPVLLTAPRSSGLLVLQRLVRAVGPRPRLVGRPMDLPGLRLLGPERSCSPGSLGCCSKAGSRPWDWLFSGQGLAGILRLK